MILNINVKGTWELAEKWQCYSGHREHHVQCHGTGEHYSNGVVLFEPTESQKAGRGVGCGIGRGLM